MKQRRKFHNTVCIQSIITSIVVIVFFFVRLIVWSVSDTNVAMPSTSVKVGLQSNITALRVEVKKECPRVMIETRQGTAVVLSKTVYDRSLIMIPDHRHTLCVIEVGTADGRGTTLALIRSLDSWCRKTARSWRLFSYEGLPDKYNSAKNFLGGEEHVEIVMIVLDVLLLLMSLLC